MTDKLAFLGTGWSFPPTFDNKVEKTVLMVSGIEDIRESLTILFDTSLGERVMQPKYGASLQDLVFEPMNTSALLFIEDLVRTAIVYHEARIKLLGVDLDTSRQNDGVLLINVSFELRATNTRFNFVYPFYLAEGTDI